MKTKKTEKLKLSFRCLRAFKIFPTRGTVTIDELVKLYNKNYGQNVIRTLMLHKILKLEMGSKRMERIVALLVGYDLIAEALPADEVAAYTITAKGIHLH